jgi:hypothetical protein
MKFNVINTSLLILASTAYNAACVADSQVVIKRGITQSGANNSLVIGGKSLGSTGNSYVQGNGRAGELRQELKSFTEIRTELSADVKVSRGEAYSIKLLGDDNILPLIKFDIQNATLILHTDKNFASKTPLKILLTVTDINKFKANGSGNVYFHNLKGDRLNVELNGSGNMFAKNGYISHLNVVLHGSGDIDFGQMQSKECEVSLLGSGEILVNAQQAVNANLSGAGQIVVTGHPAKVQKTVRGAGEILVK